MAVPALLFALLNNRAMSEEVVTAGQYAVALPLAVGLLRIRKLSAPGRWLVAMFALWFLAETTFYFTRISGYQNLWISSILSVGELILLVQIFKHLLPDMPLRWMALVGILLVAIEFAIRNTWNSVSLIYESGLVVALGLMLFREMIEGRVRWDYAWCISGLMILFIGSTVYYSSYLHPDDPQLLRLLGEVHVILLFVVYGILTIGIWRLS